MTVPGDCSFVTGSIGLLETQPSWNLVNERDTLLTVGSGFPYSEFLPKKSQLRGVQIDIDGRMLKLCNPMKVGLIGDSKGTFSEVISWRDYCKDYCAARPDWLRPINWKA